MLIYERLHPANTKKEFANDFSQVRYKQSQFKKHIWSKVLSKHLFHFLEIEVVRIVL